MQSIFIHDFFPNLLLNTGSVSRPCEESRTISATNFAVSNEFTFGDNKFTASNCYFCAGEQSTHTSSGQEESNCSITPGARQINPTVLLIISMASQFTASEHLNALDISSESMSTRQRLASLRACVNQADSSIVLMCSSKHSPDAVVAHVVHLRVFVCLPVMFSVSSCTCHMH